MPRTYSDWGDGKKHTIPLAKHKKNVKTKRNAKLNDPAKFVAPRGQLDVNRDADASANLRYGGIERGQAEQGRQIPVYYQNYLDQVGGIKTAVDQGYQKGIDDTMARQQATATSDTNARTALGSQMQKDAASRGASVDPSLIANDVNAANVRNTNQAAFANLLGAQQQAQGAYFGGQLQVGAASQIQQTNRLADDVKGTATDKGLYKSQYVNDARTDERTNLIQRAAFEIPTANTVLTQKTSTANSKRTARTQAATRKAAAKEKGQTVNKYGYTNEQWARFSPSHRQRVQKSLGPSGTGPAKPKGGLTPQQQAAARTKRNTATQRIVDAEDRWNTLINTPADFGKGDEVKIRKPTPSELKERLINKEKFSPAEVHLALMWSSNKPWTAKDRAAARRLGIRLPKRKPRVSAPGGPHGTGRP